MESEIDEFEEETEDLEKEEEIEKAEKETKSNKETEQKPKGQTEEETPTERYSAFYQEQRMGIVDNVTQEIVIEGLTDFALVKLEAIKLNILDKIETVSGIN